MEHNLKSSSNLIDQFKNLPLILLRIEGFALCAAAGATYHQVGLNWWLFAILFLAPDVSMFGYLAGTSIGAFFYNLLHTTSLYFVLLALGVFGGNEVVLAVALIGLSHVGFDRLVGYGLKYPGNFRDTHLTRLAEQTK